VTASYGVASSDEYRELSALSAEEMLASARAALDVSLRGTALASCAS
jgi:hypothetical protein